MFTRLFVSHRALLTGTSLLLLAGGALCAAPSAYADDFLVGAVLFGADATGSTSSTVYQYDTNSAAGSVTPLNITANATTVGKGIAFALANGANTFSFDQPLDAPIAASGGIVGDLGLFFSSSNTSYDPSSSARTPDLMVARLTDGSAAFFVPAAGTQINDYVFSGVTSYSGATSFTLGTDTITVSDYSVAEKPNGTFTIQDSAGSPAATPEPGSLALFAGVGSSGILLAVRRRRNRSK